MNGYFYAIGGANYDKKESYIIDLDIIAQTHKKHPSILLITAANNDNINKTSSIIHYFESLGCNVGVLKSDNVNIHDVEALFEENDIIYLCGGITSRLVEYAEKINLHKMLINAYTNGKIIVGVSAGAILFFDYGYGDKDAYFYNLESVNHKIVNGLGIFNGVFCPHYQNNGLLSFHEEIKKYNLNGFALENGTALKIKKDDFTLIKSKGTSGFIFRYENDHKLEYLKDSSLYKISLFK